MVRRGRWAWYALALSALLIPGSAAAQAPVSAAAPVSMQRRFFW
jgi:hypothetical protein